jgi:1,4-alpha-glucan branching enzyme
LKGVDEMLNKKYAKDKKTCKVTFVLPEDVNASSAVLHGDFTKWEKDPVKMRRYKDGNFKVSVTLKADKKYRFRYLLNGKRWENDWQADAYASNEFGTEDSIVEV